MLIFSKVIYYRGLPVIDALSLVMLGRLPEFVFAVLVKLMMMLAGLSFLLWG